MNEELANLWIHAWYLQPHIHRLNINGSRLANPDEDKLTLTIEETNTELQKHYRIIDNDKGIEKPVITYDKYKHVVSVRGRTMPWIWHAEAIRDQIKYYDQVDRRAVGSICEANLFFVMWNVHNDHFSTVQYILRKICKYIPYDGCYQGPDVLEFLEELGANLCNIDNAKNEPNLQELWDSCLFRANLIKFKKYHKDSAKVLEDPKANEESLEMPKLTIEEDLTHLAVQKEDQE
jgi:hypothetical protein